MLEKKAYGNNYSSCIAFTEDIRFRRLIEAYKQKKILQERGFNRTMLPIREQLEEMPREEETISTPVFTYQHLQEKVQYRPLGTITHPSNLFSLHIQPTIQLPAPITMPLGQTKHQKKYYSRMNEDDKELDDFLDKLEERNYGKSKSKNLLKNNFPILNKEKVADTFGFVAEKVTTKKGIKDKNLWPAEFQIILKKINDEMNLELSATEDMQLVQATLKILMALQKCIFERIELVKAVYFKKLVLSFYDFYRK